MSVRGMSVVNWYSGEFPISEMDMSPQELLDAITRQEAETMGNRDKFAMAAMQGVLANGAIHPNNTPVNVSKLAYAMADAMLLESRKSNDNYVEKQSP